MISRTARHVTTTTTTTNKPRRILVAIGGNSLVKNQDYSAEGQRRAVVETAKQISTLQREGHQVIITHGNGPQVGFGMIRSELALDSAPAVPLDMVDAETEGEIGYLLQQAILNEMLQTDRNCTRGPVSLITQVLVDANDLAFDNPTKPVGGFFSPDVAEKKMQQLGWVMKEQMGQGWRRVVASPQPQRIIEESAIRTLVDAGHSVICLGGGGIPVVEDKQEGGLLVGVAAVIDKDSSSAKLAVALDCDCIIFSTAVPAVFFNYNKPDQRPLHLMTYEEASHLLNSGQFGAGSMAPKVTAALSFLSESTNQNCKAIVTDPASIVAAFQDVQPFSYGTHIIKQ